MNKIIVSSPDRELLEQLGGQLRKLRKARRLTATAAAKLAGLNRTTVHRAEAGDNPTLLTLVRLLRVYGNLSALESLLRAPEISPMDLIRERKPPHD